MLRLAEEPEAFAKLIERVDEWYEKSPGKIARDQSTRMLGAMTRETWKSAGAKKLRWVTLGKNCPFCNVLDGRVVSIDKQFVDAGSVMYVDTETGDHEWYTKDGGNWWDPDGPGFSGSLLLGPDKKENPNVIAMKFHGTKFHPPIHQGCDCRIIPG